MKKSINKYLRNTVIFVLVLLISASSLFIYRELKVPKFEEEMITLYNYRVQPGVNYSVGLSPNILYDNHALGEGKLYITQFVNNIQVAFNYEYMGSEVADITGDYEVIAIIEGYQSGDREGASKNIWRKDFILFPKEVFELTDKGLLLNREILIKLDDYKEFVNNVIENSKVNSQVRMIVSMNVNLKALTENGLVDEKAAPSITIPLNTNYFEIVKSQTGEKLGAIEEPNQVQLPNNKNVIILNSVALGMFLFILLGINFKTAGIQKDQFTKSLERIFKKHGSRLVALNNNLLGSFKEYNTVISIEDLVRIADETGKPIYYNHSSVPTEISQFYTYDGSQVYIFNLEEDVKRIEAEKNMVINAKNKESTEAKKV